MAGTDGGGTEGGGEGGEDAGGDDSSDPMTAALYGSIVDEGAVRSERQTSNSAHHFNVKQRYQFRRELRIRQHRRCVFCTRNQREGGRQCRDFDVHRLGGRDANHRDLDCRSNYKPADLGSTTSIVDGGLTIPLTQTTRCHLVQRMKTNFRCEDGPSDC